MSLGHTFKSHVFAGDVVHDKERHRNELRFRSERYLRHFLNLCGAGERLTITITTRRPKRTESQNAYYWLYLGIISQETGNGIEELHEFFKGKFLTKEISEVFGQKVRIKGSTTDLSVSGFCEYILNIEVESGVPAPDTSNYDLVPLRPRLQ